MKKFRKDRLNRNQLTQTSRMFHWYRPMLSQHLSPSLSRLRHKVIHSLSKISWQRSWRSYSSNHQLGSLRNNQEGSLVRAKPNTCILWSMSVNNQKAKRHLASTPQQPTMKKTWVKVHFTRSMSNLALRRENQSRLKSSQMRILKFNSKISLSSIILTAAKRRNYR